MKKPIEKQPIDELFARKLGNMSLPPKADGFERLQARLGQSKPDAKIVFWRNPTMQRYMAAAACLLLVCLFGWLYWPSGNGTVSNETQVAVNKPVIPEQIPAQEQEEKAHLTESEVPDIKNPALPEQKAPVEQLAKVDKSSINKSENSRPVDRTQKTDKPSLRNVVTVSNEPVLAQTKPVERKNETVTSTVVAPATTSTTEQLAENKPTAKPAPTAERVLVVTIAEPEALVAARQAAVASIDEKTVVADKPAKESKGNSLWQQVKRIKQGEILARGDSNDNESSLLGRAYSGLKHSLEKDKSAKQ